MTGTVSEMITSRELSIARGISPRAARKRLKSLTPHRASLPGGGWVNQYRRTDLSHSDQAAINRLPRFRVAPQSDPEPAPKYDREELSRWAHNKRNGAQRAEGERRAAAMRCAQEYRKLGFRITEALSRAANDVGRPVETLRNYWYGTNGTLAAKDVHPGDWYMALIPRTVGGGLEAECSVQAWEMFKGLYLDQRRDALTTCYRRTARTAAAKGWAWPSISAIRRKIEREFSDNEIIYLREGSEALEKTFPPQERDRSMFRSMEAINGDGVLFKPWCLWPDGTVARPKVWYWQDLASGKILSRRTDVSENSDMIRLAFRDLVSQYGIPGDVYTDNTLAVAGKQLTGGTRNRFRWKIKPEDPLGVIPKIIGRDVSFTLPAHGQSKPIERAFKDLRELIDHHPKFGKRGTKANPLPIDDFIAIMEAEVAAHNAQTGRRGGNCHGRSFDETFEESYDHAATRRPTSEQLRMLLLVAEKVFASRQTGAVSLGRGPNGANRYWAPKLADYKARWLAVRFDPQNLHQSVHVSTLDEQFICEADCTWKAGFADSQTGRAYNREKARYKKETRQSAETKHRITALEAIQHVPDVESATPSPSKVRAGDFRSKAPLPAPINPDTGEVTDLEALRAAEEADQDERESRFSRGVAAMSKDFERRRAGGEL